MFSIYRFVTAFTTFHAASAGESPVMSFRPDSIGVSDEFQPDDGGLWLSAPKCVFPVANPGAHFKSFAADRCRRCR
jgi:hypothetical protein